MIEVVEAKARACDACGARMDGGADAGLTVYVRVRYAEEKDGRLTETVTVHEAEVAGDYCEECCERLASAVCETIPTTATAVLGRGSGAGGVAMTGDRCGYCPMCGRGLVG